MPHRLRYHVVTTCFALTCLASVASAATADLSLTLTVPQRFVGGEVATAVATVHNGGPDSSGGLSVFIENQTNFLVTSGSLAPNESRDVPVRFQTSRAAGRMTVTGRVLQTGEALDPNPANDTASAALDVFAMVDLSVFVGRFPLQKGKTTDVVLDVFNNSSDLAAHSTAFITFPDELEVVRPGSNCVSVDRNTYRCSFDVLFFHAISVFQVRPVAASGDVQVVASIESPDQDWNPSDNRWTATLHIFPLPDFTIAIAAPAQLDQANRATVEYSIRNDGDIAATDVVADVARSVGNIVSSAGEGWICTAQTSSFAPPLHCVNAGIPAHEVSALSLTYEFPAHEIRAALKVNVTQAPNSVDFPPQEKTQKLVFYRDFNVTTTADSGPGSLRQAITDANAQCSSDDAYPCRIAFRIPDLLPDEGWFTIRPDSPLPTITATDVAVDGSTQLERFSASGSRPRLFLLGDRAGAGDGLRFSAGIVVVRELAIGGFAENGIELLSRSSPSFLNAGEFHLITGNYIGVDPAGAHAVPNLRGISGVPYFGAEISNNVISGNIRSGIFETGSATIRNNRIGVAAESDASVPNGASGIFTSGGVIEANIIANNGEFGVSTQFPFASPTLLANTIAHNKIQNVDFGLDGPTSGPLGQTAPMWPVFDSALYDAAANETVITGTSTSTPNVLNISFFDTRVVTVFVYANRSNRPEAEQFLGTAVTRVDGRFTLRYQGDLRGNFISGTANAVTHLQDEFPTSSSSELGPAFEVSPRRRAARP